MNKQEVGLLGKEVELLMAERARLLRVAGAAAALVASLDASALPRQAVNAAEILSQNLNSLAEETLRDALGAVDAHVSPSN